VRSGKSEGPRPITGRALQSLRDRLRPIAASSRFLDLFAGHGRFGLAMLEESAPGVVFVERDRREAAKIAEAARRYGDRARVVTGDAFRFRPDGAERFDVVFADPPFPDWSPDTFERLAALAARVTETGGLFLVKAPKAMVPCPSRSPWVFRERVVFGDSAFDFYDHEEAP
jgi:16S rRNA (guanine966-N2)-methyltransferase